jgi:hypothetical protein
MNHNQKTIVIGIAGLARSGKDTIADFLQEALNRQACAFPTDPRYERYSFATPFKQMIKVGLGLEDKDPRAGGMYCQTYRHIAQTLGTEWGRNLISPSIWVDIASHRCAGKLTIISDVRFNDEAEFCRKHGIMIHVDRIYSELELSNTEQAHSSEAGVDCLHGDYKILNDGNDLEQLEELIKSHVLNDVLELLAHKEAWDVDTVVSTIVSTVVSTIVEDYNQGRPVQITEPKTPDQQLEAAAVEIAKPRKPLVDVGVVQYNKGYKDGTEVAQHEMRKALGLFDGCSLHRSTNNKPAQPDKFPSHTPMKEGERYAVKPKYSDKGAVDTGQGA